MKKQLKNNESGFTIIEVMIVLAIAALILVVVLVAIPQLQRNQRNSARQSVASRIVAEINNYAGNNNGEYPAQTLASGVRNFGTANTPESFFGRYLGCDNNTANDCDVNIEDPQTGFPVGLTVGNTTPAPETTVGQALPEDDAGSINYSTEAICDGEASTDDGASPRNFTFQIRLEGGAVYCLDNR